VSEDKLTPGKKSARTKGPEKLSEYATAAAMTRTRPKYTKLVKEAIEALGGKAKHKQILEYAKKQNFGDLNERTLRAHLNFMAVNYPSRVDFPINNKARDYNPDYDVLYKTDRGVVEIYDSVKHGEWTIMIDKKGNPAIAKDGVIESNDSENSNSDFEKIKRFCVEELPSPKRNYREIVLKKLLDDENFVVTKDMFGESVSKLNPEGNPQFEEPKNGYKKAACEMIEEYLVKPSQPKLVPIVKDQGDSYSLMLSTSTKEEQVNELKSICGKAIANWHATKLMKDENQCWFVQAQRHGKEFENFKKGSFVGVDYYDICNFDLSGMTKLEIKARTGNQKTTELYNISQIKQGDVIAVVSGNNSVEEFTIATSDYYFLDSDTERNKHRVNVEYLNFGTTEIGKGKDPAIVRNTKKIKNFLLGENEPQYFLLRHRLKGPWKDEPGKTYHVGRNAEGRMGNLVKAILGAGVGTKTVWWTASGKDVYLWGYGTISKIETKTEDKDWNLKYDNFKFFEGDADIQGRKLKKATESINKQIHDLEDNSKETGFNWQQSINRIPKKLYEEITGDRSTMSSQESISEEKLDPYIQALQWKPNLILYGPPGTGKTFHATQIAELITREQYTDKIDITLKPQTWLSVATNVLLENNGAVTNYQDITKDAATLYTNDTNGKTPHETIAKDIRNDIEKNGNDSFYVHPSDGMYGLKTPTTFVKAAEIILFANNKPMKTREISDIIRKKGLVNTSGETPERTLSTEFLRDSQNGEDSTFVQTAPATFILRKQIKTSSTTQNNSQQYYKTVTFHQTFSYEEFMEGIKAKPTEDGTGVVYDVEDGIFKEFCETATDDPKNKYIMIIDEINRGNISKIFGELITIIEKDKREDKKITLAYSKKEFSVPKNVLIIGTMNTADQSLTHLDAALKRRFTMMEIYPDPSVLRNYKVEGKINLTDLLEAINTKLVDNKFRDGQIGHSYFMSGKYPLSKISELQMVFAYDIIPLLREYFYDDESKIKGIFGEGNWQLWFNEKSGDINEKWQGSDGEENFVDNIKKSFGV